jgi:hypothetical protein
LAEKRVKKRTSIRSSDSHINRHLLELRPLLRGRLIRVTPSRPVHDLSWEMCPKYVKELPVQTCVVGIKLKWEEGSLKGDKK